MTALRPLITLHSGGLGTRPNSLEYLDKARLTAPDIVEIDVRCTRDGVAILNHDPWMNAGGRPLIIAENDFHDLKEAEPRLLTLLEALDFSRIHGLRLNLDLKEIAAASPMLDLLQREDPGKNHLITGCRLDEVRELRSHTREINILLNVEEAPPGGYASSMAELCALASELGCYGLNINYIFCQPELPEICLHHSLPLFVWTVDTAEDMRRMLGIGVHSITTHDVDLLRGVIAEVLKNR